MTEDNSGGRPQHLIYCHGSWYQFLAWTDSGQIGPEKEPEVGDTFSEFTSFAKWALADLKRRGLGVVVLRTAMWGERDFRIAQA